MKTHILIATLLLLSINGIAQERNWTTQKSSDEKVTIKSDIINGNNGKIIYYIAITTGNITLAQAESYMRNSTNYKDFLENTTESTEIKSISNNEWVTYCYFDAPWPMPNSDAVQKFTFTKTTTGFEVSGAVISGIYAMKDVPRMQTNNITYVFNKINSTTTEITIKANFETTGDVPKWLLKNWFPDGPSEIIQNLIKGASKQ
jgi:hypothetical protein